MESGSSAGHDATIGVNFHESSFEHLSRFRFDATKWHATSAVTNHRKPHLSTCCMFVLFHIQLIFESQHPGDWFSISSFWEALWGTQGVAWECLITWCPEAPILSYSAYSCLLSRFQKAAVIEIFCKSLHNPLWPSRNHVLQPYKSPWWKV